MRYLLACARQRGRGLAQLDARQAAAESARVQLAQKRTVATADVERALRLQARTLTERDHVVGLADRSERAPASVGGRVRGVLGVRLLVEVAQRGPRGRARRLCSERLIARIDHGAIIRNSERLRGARAAGPAAAARARALRSGSARASATARPRTRRLPRSRRARSAKVRRASLRSPEARPSSPQWPRACEPAPSPGPPG